MFMSWPSYGENRTLAGLGAGEHSKDPKLYIQVLELYQTEANTSSRETFKVPGGPGLHGSPAWHGEDSPGLTSFPGSQSVYLTPVTLLQELLTLGIKG